MAETTAFGTLGQTKRRFHEVMRTVPTSFQDCDVEAWYSVLSIILDNFVFATQSIEIHT